MAELTDVNIDDYDEWTARTVLPGDRQVAVSLDSDDEVSWKEAERLMQWGVDRMTEPALIGAEESVVSELIDIAFENADEPPSADVYSAVAEDVAMTSLTVSADGTVSLLFASPKLYPDKTIACELDDDLEVAEITIG